MTSNYFLNWCGRSLIVSALILPSISTGCKKFVDIDPPITSVNAGNIYASDKTAISVLTGIYATISFDNNNIYPGAPGFTQLSLYSGLSADELNVFEGAADDVVKAYYKNTLTTTTIGGIDYWSKIYGILYIVNAAIEGLDNTNTLTPTVKSQLLGEAHFMRAFCYFYLINLYGGVPLVVTTDYETSGKLGKSSSQDVYKQIKADLLLAQSLMADKFFNPTLTSITTERVRPNKTAATAMLARVYLYTKEWANAEAEATSVINNQAVYDMVPLNEVFLMNSKETIWSLQPVFSENGSNTGEGRFFILPSEGPTAEYPVYLNPNLVKSFDAEDQRAVNWIGNVTAFGVKYSYPLKYKIGNENVATAEYPIMLRLGEQYLIRAEARAQQANIKGANSAQSDLDVIRTRAGLQGTTAGNQTDMIAAILDERRHELFSEFGHRWFDLKRTNTIDAVMVSASKKKGGLWKSDWALYPIPAETVLRTPGLKQNPGYE
jgi:hypothetical protein